MLMLLSLLQQIIFKHFRHFCYIGCNISPPIRQSLELTLLHLPCVGLSVMVSLVSLERSSMHTHRKLFVTIWLGVHAVIEASPADIIINHLFKGPQCVSPCHLLHDLHNYCCETDRQDFEPGRQDTQTCSGETQSGFEGWKWVLAF